ncbi:MAG TPA: hypothetical protein VFP77_06115, partial [Gemmatimonadaceae bacterium]|nr:hypothetical protein [Gemmatimonadaceae bacterium]
PDNRFVQKTITLRDKGKEYMERVRLLSALDLQGMLRGAGFTVERLFGDYGGSAWSENSPRTIVFASRQ